MPCFPIPTAHLFQRKRRVWFKEQAALRGKLGGRSSAQAVYLSQRRFAALLTHSAAPPLPTRNASLVSCGNPIVAASIPVTNATRRQWKKNAAKHRVAKHNVRRDLVMSREGAFSSFCRLTKRDRVGTRNNPSVSFADSRHKRHTPFLSGKAAKNCRISQRESQAPASGKAFLPPSDEGGGFCGAKDGGRELLRSATPHPPRCTRHPLLEERASLPLLKAWVESRAPPHFGLKEQKYQHHFPHKITERRRKYGSSHHH